MAAGRCDRAALDPDLRFDKHRAGIHANHFVFSFVRVVGVVLGLRADIRVTPGRGVCQASYSPSRCSTTSLRCARSRCSQT